MKNQDQINEMISKIKAGIARLPAINAFGESNAEEIELLRNYEQDLIKGPPYRNTEVTNWVNDKWSELSDME